MCAEEMGNALSEVVQMGTEIARWARVYRGACVRPGKRIHVNVDGR